MESARDLLLTLYRHGRWANRRLLGAAAALSPDELRTPVGAGAFGDLLETLLHIYDVEESWLDRIRTGTSGPTLLVRDYPDLPVLTGAWDALEFQLEAFLLSLDDVALNEVRSYRSQAGSSGALPVSTMLANLFLHSQQHRGEIALALTELGRSPGDLGLIFYLKQQGEIHPV